MTTGRPRLSYRPVDICAVAAPRRYLCVSRHASYRLGPRPIVFMAGGGKMAQLTVSKRGGGRGCMERGAQLLQKLNPPPSSLPARNSFYDILINAPDNSALSSARELNGISRPLRCGSLPPPPPAPLFSRLPTLPCLVMPRTFNEYYPVCEPCEAIELISLPFSFHSLFASRNNDAVHYDV